MARRAHELEERWKSSLCDDERLVTGVYGEAAEGACTSHVKDWQGLERGQRVVDRQHQRLEHIGGDNLRVHWNPLGPQPEHKESELLQVAVGRHPAAHHCTDEERTLRGRPRQGGSGVACQPTDGSHRITPGRPICARLGQDLRCEGVGVWVCGRVGVWGCEGVRV